MNTKPISKKRQALIDEKLASSLQVGEKISVKYEAINSYAIQSDKGRSVNCIILEFINDEIRVIREDTSIHKNENLIKLSDIICRDIVFVGANPFDEHTDSIRPVAFTLQSILFGLNILGEKDDTIAKYDIKGVPMVDFNWNPFVYDKQGVKQYYQREFVWSLKDKQLLIESIYQGIDCGKILIRNRSWGTLEKMQADGETVLAFREVVDGKQRLDAVRGFIQLEYPDMAGNYFSDLSYYSQHRFTDHQLFMYAEMPESTTDEEVIRQFLKMNFSGVPQSEDHINYVRSLQKKL